MLRLHIITSLDVTCFPDCQHCPRISGGAKERLLTAGILRSGAIAVKRIPREEGPSSSSLVCCCSSLHGYKNICGPLAQGTDENISGEKKFIYSYPEVNIFSDAI